MVRPDRKEIMVGEVDDDEIDRPFSKPRRLTRSESNRRKCLRKKQKESRKKNRKAA